MLIDRRKLLLGAVVTPVLGSIAVPAFAAKPSVYMEDGIAIDGTDAVAYFTKAAPIRGKKEIMHSWKGATWRFSSAENRDAFAADPQAYAPQYGGYCAWAVSQGYTASTTPEAWKIVDGKLYLNYSKRIQRRWERNIPANIAAGDRNWPAVLA